MGPQDNPASPTKVLYIGGAGRSGSTLLNNTLGQMAGYFAVGELIVIWNRGLISNQRCGCGKPFDQCEFWPRTIQRAYGGPLGVDAAAMNRAKQLVNARSLFKHIPYALALLFSSRRRHPQIAWFGSQLKKLYHAILDESGSKVVIDSSKRPAYAYFLSSLTDIDVYMLHMIRDPRGIYYSQRKRKVDPDTQEFLPTYNPVAMSIQWLFWNLFTELTFSKKQAQYMRLRYEDLIDLPAKNLQRIVDFCGEPTPLPLDGERSITLRPTHSVAGNPNRFESGKTELRPDVAWKTNLPSFDKFVITIMTWPLLLRYGYGLAGKH